MAAPSRESTGRLVTDSTFTLPYAYPSSADYSIESQFDDVPGPYRRQRGTIGKSTFGNSTREDYASYLRSIGGGGARCSFDPGHPSWCGVNPGPERYEDGRGFPVARPSFMDKKPPRDSKTLQKTLRALGEKCWPNATVGSVVVELSSKEPTYALPKKAERQTSSKSGWARDRSIRFRKDQEDRLFGKYDHPAKFAVRTNLTGANATIGCKIGKGKRVSFLKDAVASHDHFQDSSRATVARDCERWRAGTPGAKQRPAFGNAIPRDCLPKQGVPRKTPRPVFENKALHKLLTENKPIRRRKDGSIPAERDLDDDYEDDFERRWWPRQTKHWPPVRKRPVGRKTKIRQRQFGRQARPALAEAMKVAGRLKGSSGCPGEYSPKCPNRPGVIDESTRTFNVHLRPATSPPKLRSPVEVPDIIPRSIRKLPKPPDWRVWQSPVAKRLSSSRNERRRLRTAQAKTRAEAERARRPSTSAAVYRIRSPLSSRGSLASKPPAPAPQPEPAASSEGDEYSDDAEEGEEELYSEDEG